jgi:hypothetical protein
MIETVIAVLLFGILLVLIEARISIGTRVAVMERDVAWISASLAKWGMIAPRDRELDRKP